MPLPRFLRVVPAALIIASSASWAAPADTAAGQGRPRNSAATPMPRGDENSKTAHEQLVNKAKSGRIDLYFMGDSIVRRWGCTDPQYARFMENWKKNFYGWNAGNFGWGADSLQNILWRAQNGELDGVNPKVIVMFGGTNNVGQRPGSPAKVADIVSGFKAIVATCRQKAPNAKIILVGILPRGDIRNEEDRKAVFKEIQDVNRGISKLADGFHVFYVDVTSKIAGADGKPLPGMLVDGLHTDVNGYQAVADGLNPLLTKFLGPRASTDIAPPPTGDPKLGTVIPGT